MSRFNLIDEKWIPVRLLNGTRDELGIRATLLQAKEIAAIEDGSPLVVAALHRFLLAVLYRALEGPTDIDQAKAFFNTGFPGDKIEAYLEKWRDRFWLFDERYPFGQIPSFVPKKWRAWPALAAEHNADNAKVLFDHVDVQNPGTLAEAIAVRWLLAAQTFSVGSGKGELSYTSGAPSATAAMVLPSGGNLQDTLLFALVPQNSEISAGDVPLWEREPESVDDLRKGPKRPAGGLADRYFWRSRTIRMADDLGEGIKHLAFDSGIRFDSADAMDPMLAYREDEKFGILPIRFQERGLWRNFDSLLPDSSRLAPRVIEHATVLAKSEHARFPHVVMVLGLANDQAKIEFWRMERFALPGALAGDRFIRSDFYRFLKTAEETQGALWSACSLFARDMINRGDRDPHKKDVRAFVSQMPCIPWYWSVLEARFHEIVQAYTLEKNPDEIELEWLQSVRDVLKGAWDQQTSSVATGDAWAIRAAVKAEGPIRRKLKELDGKIADFKKSLGKEDA